MLFDTIVLNVFILAHILLRYQSFSSFHVASDSMEF